MIFIEIEGVRDLILAQEKGITEARLGGSNTRLFKRNCG
jgi:hypothetical protein